MHCVEGGKISERQKDLGSGEEDRRCFCGGVNR